MAYSSAVKTALIIRHVPHEGVAGYRQPIEAAGYSVSRVDVTDPEFSSLDLREPDLLIMMGGPMGVYEQDTHPWITCQMRRLSLRLMADRPTLGVCFGAQMIASALGATVYPGASKEVGFHPVSVDTSVADNPLSHIDAVPVLHWHGDTFTRPDGVEMLGSTSAYDHQAFRRGRNVLALQFHAEMGEDPRFDAWLEQWPDAVIDAGGCPLALRETHDVLGPAAVAAGRAMIGAWLSQLN